MMLVDHVQQNRGKAEHRIGRLAVRGAQASLGKRVKGAKSQRVAVDQQLLRLGKKARSSALISGFWTWILMIPPPPSLRTVLDCLWKTTSKIG